MDTYEEAHIYSTEDVRVPLLHSEESHTQGAGIFTVQRFEDLHELPEVAQVQNEGLI